MKESYIISIVRPGMADIPEMIRTPEPEVAAEVVRCLLRCHDDRIASVSVRIDRITTKEMAV